MEIHFQNGRPECLEHLTLEEVKNLVVDYMNTHISVRDICIKYNIVLNDVKDLRFYLPYIISEENCPYCNTPMYINVVRPLPRRALNKASVKRREFLFCDICGHGNRDNIDRISGVCTCKNCANKPKPPHANLSLYGQK